MKTPISPIRTLGGFFCSSVAIMMAASTAAVAAPPTMLQAFHTSVLERDASDLAQVRYRRSSGQNDDDAEAMFDEGQYEFDSQDYRAARRIFERLVEDYPKSDYALKAQRYLANIYRRSDERASRPRREVKEAPTKRSLPLPVKPYSVRPDRPKTVKRPPITPAAIRPDAPMQRQLLMSTGDRIFFAANSNRLGAKARSVLRRQAVWLNKNEDLLVRIEGHSHDSGAQDDNLILSLKRAEQVRDRLIEEGVSADRITVYGRGRAAPIAICDSAMCAAQNRRVMTIVYRADSGVSLRRRASLPKPQR